MLTFKQKFLDAIRKDEKTQTLRIWKSLRIRAGQKNFIPGVGPIWIDAVDEVFFDQLTDADAIPDGFSSLEALKDEIFKIYGSEPEGKLYRVRFHRLDSCKTVSSSPSLPETTDLSASPSVPPPAPPQTNDVDSIQKAEAFRAFYGEKNAGGKPRSSRILRTGSSENEKSKTTDAPSGEMRGFVQGIKSDLANRIQGFLMRKSVKKKRSEPVFQPSDSNPNSELSSPQMETQRMAPFNPLTEAEIVEKMIRRCRVNRNVCDWNHEPGKSQDFFALFRQSPRNEKGIPTLDGYRLRSLMRDQLSEEAWEEICWIAAEVCAAWTEWQYAIEHWNANESSEK